MVTLALAVAIDGTWCAWGMEGTAGARVTLFIRGVLAHADQLK